MISIVSKLVTLRPKVEISNNTLIAKSNFISRVVFLFSRNKIVLVDPRKKLITIESVWFWFLGSKKHIPFKRIEVISYRYDNFWFDFGLNFLTNDQIEEFSVLLKLNHPNETIKILSFVGEGVVNSPIFDPESLNISGDQEISSRNYVELLMEYTGKKLI